MPANASQGQLSDKVSGKIPAQIIGKKSYLQLEKIEATYPSAPALLLIHGWGASSSVWQPCSELLRQHFDLYFFDLPGHGRNAGCAFASPDELLDAFSVTLLPRLPAKFSVLGWSLGGLIASLLAARFGDRVSALITTATNVSFVASEQWPKGIAHDVFERFAAGISIDSDAAQRADILRRFHGLQFHGSAAARRQLRAYQQCLAATHYSSHGLWQGLQWLQEGDLQSCWRQLSLPVLHQYGVEDPLLPGTVAAAIKKEFPDHCVACFDHSGHLPFFDQPSRWVECCVDFLSRQLPTADRDKQAIAQAFSRAALGYDDIASFQRDTGRQLLDLLPQCDARVVLDLGAGTGYFSSPLRRCYPQALLVEMDLSLGMLEQGRQRNASASLQLQGDMDRLSLADDCLDIVYANLSMQWSQLPAVLLQRLFSSLREDGVVTFSTLLDGSVAELATAWSQVDRTAHINHFVGEETLRAACLSAGFEICHWRVERSEQHFLRLPDLLRSVRGIGAKNRHPDRAKGLMGKDKYRAFCRAYDDLKTPQGEFPLSYRVLYAVLRKVV